MRGVLVGITGDERANLPELIEHVDPVPESVQVFSQSNVFVDLAGGHTGVLVVDGVEIDTVNVDEFGSVQSSRGNRSTCPRSRSMNRAMPRSPSRRVADAPITGFAEGEHRAQVIYWKVDDGRQRARSFTWTFQVV